MEREDGEDGGVCFVGYRLHIQVGIDVDVDTLYYT